MNIAIVGTGKMGQAIGALLAKANHKLIFGSRQPNTGSDIAAKVSPQARGASIPQALKDGEVVILALPYAAAIDLVGNAETKDALKGKTVIDITNPLGPDHMSLTVGHTTSAAEEIARRLSGAHVVKAFNTIFADILRARAQGQSTEVSAFVAGDDPAAKEKVLGLVTSMGFQAVDAGELTNARYIEPMTVLQLRLAYGSRALGSKIGFRFVGAGSTAAHA